MVATIRRSLVGVFLATSFVGLSAGCRSIDVSSDPRVSRYMAAHRELVKPCEILGSGRTRLLVEAGRRYPAHDGLERQHFLPAGTRIALARIEEIRRDGFVLFEARGRAFPNGRPEGVLFSYRWGHGGTSPQAPWEPPGERLKRILGIE